MINLKVSVNVARVHLKTVNNITKGGSRVRPLMQMTKSYFLPMKC